MLIHLFWEEESSLKANYLPLDIFYDKKSTFLKTLYLFKVSAAIYLPRLTFKNHLQFVFFFKLSLVTHSQCVLLKVIIEEPFYKSSFNID